MIDLKYSINDHTLIINHGHTFLCLILQTGIKMSKYKSIEIIIYIDTFINKLIAIMMPLLPALNAIL